MDLKYLSDELKPSYLHERRMSQKKIKQFMNLALETYAIDNTKPVSYYYQLFIDKSQGKNVTERLTKEFFEDQVIEI